MIYLSLLLLLFILAVFDSCVQKQYFAFPRIIDSNNVNVNLRGIRNKIPISFIFMFLWFIYATTIMGLRGNFSTDYQRMNVFFLISAYCSLNSLECTVKCGNKVIYMLCTDGKADSCWLDALLCKLCFGKL